MENHFLSVFLTYETPTLSTRGMKSSPLAHPLLIEPGACFATHYSGVRQTLAMKTAISPGMLYHPIVNAAHISGD
jgi:hypothetical protein